MCDVFSKPVYTYNRQTSNYILNVDTLLCGWSALFVLWRRLEHFAWTWYNKKNCEKYEDIPYRCVWHSLSTLLWPSSLVSPLGETWLVKPQSMANSSLTRLGWSNPKAWPILPWPDVLQAEKSMAKEGHMDHLQWKTKQEVKYNFPKLQYCFLQ